MKTAYNTNAKAFEKVFDDLGFMSKFEMNADTYKAAFTKELNPYKDEVAVFKVDEKNIKITPSVYSTLYQPRFVVTVPVEALHNNNQVVFYSYKYYVGMEKGKIELIQFMAVKASDQYEYTCGMNEAAVTKVAQEYSVDKDALVAAAQSVDMTLEELIATTKEGDNPNPINVAEAIKIANGGTAVEGEDSSEGQATEGNVTN